MSALRAQCPGCGAVVFATNETVYRLRAKRHARSCKPLRKIAKAMATKAPRWLTEEPAPWWRRLLIVLAFWRRRP